MKRATTPMQGLCAAQSNVDASGPWATVAEDRTGPTSPLLFRSTFPQGNPCLPGVRAPIHPFLFAAHRTPAKIQAFLGFFHRGRLTAAIFLNGFGFSTAMTKKAAQGAATFPVALLCDPGCENIIALEAKELLGKTAASGALGSGYVTVADCSVKDAATLIYRSQSALRVLALVSKGRISSPNDLLEKKKELLDFDYSPFLPDGGSFRVTCDRLGDQEWRSHEVEEALGALLHEEKRWPVDLKKPALTLFCQSVDDTYVLGIDLCGRDLAKREYKAFHTRRSLRSTVAYAAIRAAGYTGKEVLLDPFMTDGGIVIEAALYATKMSPHRFRKEFAFTVMPIADREDWNAFFTALDGKIGNESKVAGYSAMVRTLQMARANAKLAGVEKSTVTSKCEVSWLDTKLDEASVNLIVTVPPTSGKNTPLKDVEKLQDDLFYQAKYVLKKDGTVLLISEKKAEFLNAATRHKFSLKDEKEIHMGGTTLKFLVFGKEV